MRKIITIVGPTGAGKSSLAIDLADEFGGQIISADSRQIYRYLDIVSGKTLPADQKGIHHHLLSIINPEDNFSVAQYQKLAYTIIDDLHARRLVPFLVGGTGLYVSAVKDGYVFTEVSPDSSLRTSLEHLSVSELRAKLLLLAPSIHLSHSESFNRHRLIRKIEKITAGQSEHSASHPRYTSLTIGLDIARPELEKNIRIRVQSRLTEGAIEEVAGLHEMLQEFFEDNQLEKKIKQIGLSYHIIWEYLQHSYNYDQMVEKFVRAELAYAKRQMTWWRKDSSIIWVPHHTSIQEIRQLIHAFLE